LGIQYFDGQTRSFSVSLGNILCSSIQDSCFLSFIDICLNPDKNRVPKPFDAVRGFLKHKQFNLHLFVIIHWIFFFTNNLVISRNKRINQQMWSENKLLHRIHCFAYQVNSMAWFNLRYNCPWLNSSHESHGYGCKL